MNIAPGTVDIENSSFNSINKTEATLTCGINRKVNIGNFENIDVYCSVTLPVDIQSVTDIEDLKELIHDVASEGFEITSREANQRYKLIKDLK